jgi:hypothetical protein
MTMDDEVLAALADAVAILEEHQRRAQQLIAKADRLVRLRRDGLPWEEILLSEEHPLMSVLFAETAEAMMHANSRVRRTQAQALRRAGVTLTRIGELLGVTRQRVSALLRGRR